MNYSAALVWCCVFGPPLVSRWRAIARHRRYPPVLEMGKMVAVDRHREFRNAVSEPVQSPWAGWPVSGLRTFLWCCKFMSEHALHPLAHHSRFVQLSGLLPTGPAAQFELLARRLQMLEMKLRDKVAGSLFRGSIEEDSHIICLGTRRTRGLLMIAPELEEFALGVVAKETAAAKER